MPSPAAPKAPPKPVFPAEGSDAPKSFILAERVETKKGQPDLKAGGECAVGEGGLSDSFVRAHPWLVATKTRLRELAGDLDVAEGFDSDAPP